MFIRSYLGASTAKQVQIVALDRGLIGVWQPLATTLRAPMFAAVNDMMLDVLAAVARKEYVDRRRRQAKATGRFRGNKENTGRNDGIAALLRAGSTWRQVQDATGCSKGTVAKVRKRLDAASAGNT